jgi:hypothetical protein
MQEVQSSVLLLKKGAEQVYLQGCFKDVRQRYHCEFALQRLCWKRTSGNAMRRSLWALEVARRFQQVGQEEWWIQGEIPHMFECSSRIITNILPS